ncbi:single-stranded-DNA-specific exonuclease RecJ [Francisella tularensis]|uniref:single-stranded-DNA-specific exonuclease RecJ n=1 Tax=Francisella tularensis TaxID=263 RepID=UPI0000F593B2|nr:single-stranded-DNA-specific exonuclease RecJ [Francisella tularensis]ABO47292.1 single-stranded-DNA-specific exonuclease RecJ [Francisella tularensis subsp. tularensis WY96-3418]AJI63582.1 single-stranded-DNA-specific exonuclease RecJ [Francisella tularensis subsp. tularensis]AKH92451.1 single-stranded DNA exonuclease [Francisella tularensis subsp. tularensis WY-00W4114]AKU73801.1 single-stranded-DNA-specific exonuclease RecJ [Francisella tularensis subsp. tularensis]EKM85354.1 single-stra
MLIKQKKIDNNIFSTLLAKGYDSFTAKIISARVRKIENLELILNGSIKDLSSPFLFKDIEKAVERLYQALQNNEIIGLETDHDCDGQTSHAILYEALTKIFGHPKEKIRSYIGHRLQEGYGLSESLMNRILTDKIRPSLIITADNGSTDEPRIAILKKNGIDTIITDHHAIPPEGTPKSAIAVLNPTQQGCNYPDKAIAGCMVAWLFMAALRRKYLQNNKMISQSYGLSNLLDFVAIGTVADCVSMATSHNNRIVTKFGIEQLKNNQRLCWDFVDKDKLSSEYIGFSIAPILNSDGRVSDALGSVSFLLEEDEHKIEDIFDNLKQQNNQRKEIQKKLTQEAIVQAYQLNQQKNSLCILLEDGHSGIHGISASRIKEMFGKAVIIFSQTQHDSTLISGSARSIDNIHIKTILDNIAVKEPQLIIKYGGHKGAAGLTIKKSDFDKFYQLFESEITDIITKQNIILEPIIEYDFELDEHHFELETLDKIDALEPFGRKFEKPLFCNQFMLENLRLVGKDKNHAQLVLRYKNISSIKAIWFNATDNKILEQLIIGDCIKACYELQKEEFLGQINLSLNIKTIEK